MLRLTIFIIALLLAVEAIEPASSWLVTLAVLSGVALVTGGRLRPRIRRIRSWVDPWSRESDW